MRTATQALKDHLAANNAFLMADLLTLQIGDVRYYWTTADTDIVYGGNTFLAAGPVVKRGRTRSTTTMEVDTLDLELLTGGSITLQGKSLTLAAVEGILDSASVTLERVFMPTWGDTSLGTRPLFKGHVASVEPSSTGVRLTVKSDVERMNRNVPPILIQPACSYQVYSAGCGLNRAANTTTVNVAAGSTQTVLNLAVAMVAAAPSGSWVVVKTGPNAGMRRMIRASTTTSVTLPVPLPYVCNVGDTIEVVKGCDKTRATCLSRFNNLARFKGFADVPKEESVA